MLDMVIRNGTVITAHGPGSWDIGTAGEAIAAVAAPGEVMAPCAAYLRLAPSSPEEGLPRARARGTLRFVRERSGPIARGDRFGGVDGASRYRPENPEGKQVQGQTESAPEAWRSEADEDWRRSP